MAGNVMIVAGGILIVAAISIMVGVNIVDKGTDLFHV